MAVQKKSTKSKLNLINDQQLVSKFKKRGEGLYHRVLLVIEHKPLRSFFIFMTLLVLLIAAGNFLRRPQPEVQKKKEPKVVKVYEIGSAPRLTVQAQIEKSGSLQIVAISGGVVQSIGVKEGQNVAKGQRLISFGANYSGSNALVLSSQIAQKSFQIAQDNYQTSKDMIGRQRDLANEIYTNFDALRNLTNDSINDTQSLINSNNEIISILNTNLQSLQSDPVTNATAILTTKQLVSQMAAANLALNTQLRSSKYQADSGKPPTELANIQKDIALKQLDIQQKTLDLNLEIGRLQVKLAAATEAMLYPSAPFAGRIERVFVKVGQYVAPGTSVVTLSSKVKNVNAVIYLPNSITSHVSTLEPTEFTLDNKTIEVFPSSISSDAVMGNLYSVSFNLPQESFASTSDKGYVLASVPLGYADTGSVVPYLPLDAVYQTSDNNFVFINKNGLAEVRQINLGEVVGSFVQVTSGINDQDVVILDRNVVNGDIVVSEE